MEKLAYSVKETAALMGVNEKTVYDLVHRADFPAFRPNGKTGRILIPRRGLTEWLEKQASNGGIT